MSSSVGVLLSPLPPQARLPDGQISSLLLAPRGPWGAFIFLRAVTRPVSKRVAPCYSPSRASCSAFSCDGCCVCGPRTDDKSAVSDSVKTQTRRPWTRVRGVLQGERPLLVVSAQFPCTPAKSFLFLSHFRIVLQAVVVKSYQNGEAFYNWK